MDRLDWQLAELSKNGEDEDENSGPPEAKKNNTEVTFTNLKFIGTSSLVF